MFKGRSLTELATELERQATTKKDFKAPANFCALSVVNPKFVDILEKGSQEFEFMVGDKFKGGVTELMHDQIGKWCQVPSTYYDRLKNGDNSDRGFLAANVNHWLKKDKGTQLIRTLDGRARAWLSNRYRTIDNFDVANAALPVLLNESKKLGGIEVVSSDVTETRLYIKAASKRLTYEVKKGDVVEMGITVSNSEVGKGSVRIEPFLYRLACLNGAVIADAAVRKFHLGRQSAELDNAEAVFRDETRQQDDKAFMMKLGDIIRAAFDDENFKRLKGLTIDATTRKIETPIQDFVEEVANRFALSERHKDSFLKNLIEGGDISQWGVANAITAIANTAESYEKAHELETIGGAIMTLPQNQWEILAEAA